MLKCSHAAIEETLMHNSVTDGKASDAFSNCHHDASAIGAKYS